MSVNLVSLHEAPLAELVRQAEELGIPTPEAVPHGDLVFAILTEHGKRTNTTYGRGVLEVHAEGFGFLRSSEHNFLPGAADIYVSQSQIRRFKLRTGDTVIGQVRSPKEGERYLALLRVESVNGQHPSREPVTFDALTAVYPDERINLGDDPLLRAIDLVAPLGLGQRGLILAPPRTGRVELLRRLADALTADDELSVTVLLIGERPEEIHEWRESTSAEVIATPFDESFARHIQVADIAFERARRLAERGDFAVLLVDSISRLLRACLAEITASGREIGGVDTAALHRIRRYMGSARALQEGGSLTVIGVVAGTSGSDMDRVLYDDLREVANWELTLSRELADRGVRPAVDVHRSGTRREERLLEPDELEHRAHWRATLTGDVLEDGATLVTAIDSAPAAT